MKVLAISLCISLLALAVSVFIILHRGNVIEQQNSRIDNLTANVEVLINGRKKDYENKVELSARVEELEREAEKDTSCFGWNDNISRSVIVRKLREDRSKIR